MAQEEFIRVGTTLYKIVNQPLINGGFVKKRIVWNNETLRQDYGKDFIATVPKYDGFCTVPNHVDYQPVVDKFLNLYEPIGHQPKEGEFPHVNSQLCNFNSVKALILHILPHLDDTIFNRVGQMRDLSPEAKLHDFKTFSKFYC